MRRIQYTALSCGLDGSCRCSWCVHSRRLWRSRAAPEISRERLRADLEFLTSARLEGRASLTPGAAAAARFIAAELGKAGVRPASGDSYLQPPSVASTSTRWRAPSA